MIVFKIRPDDLNSMIFDKPEDVLPYLEESSIGEVWTIEVLEMSEEEYKALLESDGF